MIRFHTRLAPLALAAALGALLLPAAPTLAQGTVAVTPTVTPNGSLFHYTYTVTNGTDTELAIVSFQSLFGSAITNTTAPNGFFTSYDSGNGFVSFAPTSDDNAGMFASGSSIGGFAFDSPFSPMAVSFSALNIAGDETTGPTLAPSPEPGTWVSFGVGILGVGLLAARRRRTAVTAS